MKIPVIIYRLLAISLLALNAILSVGCEYQKDVTRSLTPNSFTFLSLKTVFEFSESEVVAFETISSIKTDYNGKIIAHDFRQPHLFLFDQEGNFLQRIGKEGRGPGEFQQISSFLVGQEYLWVIDSRSIKIEKFAFREGEYVHLESLSPEREDLIGAFLGKPDDGILIANRYTIRANSKDNPTVQPISLINEKGEILIDTLFTVPITEQMTLTGSGYTWSISKIFGNKSLLAFDGKSHIYALWTDSLAIDKYSIDEGKLRQAFSYSLDPVQVTNEERDSLLSNYGPVRADLSRKLPEVKPVVEDLLIDDQQGIWVKLFTENLGRGWFCFSKEGDPMYKIDIPKDEAEVHEITGNLVLWSYQNEQGVPTMAVSKFDIP